MKRATAFIILLSLLLSTAACGDAEGQSDVDDVTQGNTTETSAATDSETDRTSIPDNLPEYNFDGREFTILTINNSNDPIRGNDEQNGELVDDAIYERRRTVEDRFNVVLAEYIMGDHRETGAEVERSVLAGDDSYDLYAGHAIVSGGPAMNGIFLNWYKVDNVDFTQPWWQQNSVEALTIDGVMPLVPSYMTMSVVANTYCMFYNKEIAENYQLEDIFDVVNSGEWTFDKLQETTRDIYQDLNGDSAANEGDLFGFGFGAMSPAVTFTWAFDIPIVERNADGGVELVLESQRTTDIVDQLYDFIYQSPNVYTEPTGQSTRTSELFATGNFLLTPGCIGHAVSILRDFDVDYSIIPYPKYDSNQEDYLTMVDGGHLIIGVPLTAKNPAETGIITEVMTAESWKNVVPAYYDVALKLKGTRDEESIAMLDKILDSVKVDFTYIYDNWQGFAFFMQDLLQAKNRDLMSYIEKNRSAKLTFYEQLYEAFDEMKNQ